MSFVVLLSQKRLCLYYELSGEKIHGNMIQINCETVAWHIFATWRIWSWGIEGRFPAIIWAHWAPGIKSGLLINFLNFFLKKHQLFKQFLLELFYFHFVYLHEHLVPWRGGGGEGDGAAHWAAAAAVAAWSGRRRRRGVRYRLLLIRLGAISARIDLPLWNEGKWCNNFKFTSFKKKIYFFFIT